MKRVGYLVFLVGCGFQSTSPGTPIDASTPEIDAPGTTTPDAQNPPPDAMIDAQVCFGKGLVQVCLDSAPSQQVSFAGMMTLDTSNASNCTKTVANPGGPELCVIAGTTVNVAGTLTAIGTRALVLISSSTLTVPGTLDVSSAISSNARRGAGSNLGSCTNPSNAQNDAGGAGGGGGASFATKGGNGGTGDLNDSGNPRGTAAAGQSSAAQAKPTILRGGCRGGDGGAGDGQHRGRGGDGGGAVYLIAVTSISINGDVFASGAGGAVDTGNNGAEQGGGGGGTGGMIGLDAPTIDIQGRIAANGGAGGGGGALNAGGMSGGDGTTINWNTRATRGMRAVDPAGDGGDGAPGTAVGQSDTIDGASSDGGGGGGGGGLGVVWIDGTVTGATKVSPAPTAH